MRLLRKARKLRRRINSPGLEKALAMACMIVLGFYLPAVAIGFLFLWIIEVNKRILDLERAQEQVAERIRDIIQRSTWE